MTSFITYAPLELAIALRESEAELARVEQALLLPASETGAAVDAATGGRMVLVPAESGRAQIEVEIGGVAIEIDRGVRRDADFTQRIHAALARRDLRPERGEGWDEVYVRAGAEAMAEIAEDARWDLGEEVYDLGGRDALVTQARQALWQRRDDLNSATVDLRRLIDAPHCAA